jgi:quercetin dioxygenase-like cupin family protein
MQTPSSYPLYRWIAAAALACAVLLPAQAEDKPGTTQVANAANQQWVKGPKDFPPGMRVMPVEGDPAQPGPYVYRVRVPSGYQWPPMKFPDERTTTILKGKLWYAEGERRNPKNMQELEAGAMFKTPANTPHYQWARTEVILQITGTGPIDNPVTYVNPEDDPRQQ